MKKNNHNMTLPYISWVDAVGQKSQIILLKLQLSRVTEISLKNYDILSIIA